MVTEKDCVFFSLSIEIGYEDPFSADSVPLLSKSFFGSPSPSLSTERFSSILYCLIFPVDFPANTITAFSR